MTSLKETNIFAEGTNIDILENDLMIIKNHLDNTSDKPGIRFNIANALEAIRVAKQYENGGVCIS